MTTTRRLDGARVVVTGGARGIGAAIATRCAGEGARIVVLDLLEDRGRATADALGGAFVAVDLTDCGGAARAVGSAITLLGGVDVLVNAAGVLRLGPLLETTPDEWDAVFAINTRAMLVTMQATARAMIAAGVGGRIINLSSMAAKDGGANEAAYAASKAAVVALTRAAALEWGCHGITVNAICPGYVLTEMGAETRTPSDVAAWTARSPLGRLASPEDVANVACFLASEEASYLTGEALNVTGGMMTH
ncbi:SDR family NAD(P)-dependent oxidoreductase [Amnibacterium sp.]|uniref:SDR family NAD(P)-dependent oxidoreductase n=1 Tax=Amnibacterium sp. TaxID=1872496 RepID=UPI00262E78FD|nr:SDR family NAD(P)-dependent oxidoreductase [Amnibacterium sp.]MCU1472340.1 short-chain dehydrogenase [Amnibacterium sp.]